jgi:hypothetical protein
VTRTIQAVFDGSVLRPDEPLPLEANTRVRLTIELLPATPASPISFLATARSLELTGPPDWSAHVDEYLYAESDQ